MAAIQQEVRTEEKERSVEAVKTEEQPIGVTRIEAMCTYPLEC
jgi:hypothetical protein